jgi:hypothetical protein
MYSVVGGTNTVVGGTYTVVGGTYTVVGGTVVVGAVVGGRVVAGGAVVVGFFVVVGLVVVVAEVVGAVVVGRRVVDVEVEVERLDRESSVVWVTLEPETSTSFVGAGGGSSALAVEAKRAKTTGPEMPVRVAFVLAVLLGFAHMSKRPAGQQRVNARTRNTGFLSHALSEGEAGGGEGGRTGYMVTTPYRDGGDASVAHFHQTFAQSAAGVSPAPRTASALAAH